MDLPILSLIQVFQKMLEMEIKNQLLMQIYKECLRRQYGSNRILEKTIWVKQNPREDNMGWTVLFFED